MTRYYFLIESVEKCHFLTPEIRSKNPRCNALLKTENTVKRDLVMQLENNIPSNPERKKEWIKNQLTIRGLSLAKLGRQNGYAHRQAVSLALRKSSPRWEFIIAQAIDLTPSEVWPERYDENHLPIKARKK